MHRIAVLNDMLEIADMLATPLRGEGYEVLTDITSIDFERVLKFKPELIVLGLHRRIRAYDRPIESLEKDIFGFKPLADMEHYPAISVVPIMLVATGVQEKDIPTSLNYDSFLTIPEDAPLYFPKVKELIETVKTRRKISSYICPHCGSRMTFTARHELNLFCPRCHTGVVVVDEENCLITAPGAPNAKPGKMELLRPSHGDTSDEAETRATKRDDSA